MNALLTKQVDTQSPPDFRLEPVSRTQPRRWTTLLRSIADVRPGEWKTVLLLTATVFLLLFAYYLLKTIREALILAEGGAYIKAYSSAGQAALLILLVPIYGFAASKLDRIRFLSGLLLFFISNLVVFYFCGVSGAREGVVFYIWVGIFNVFAVSQVWAFAADIYTTGQGTRLFPLIGVGSSVGAWLGAKGAQSLVSTIHASPYELQLIAASILVVCGGLLIAVNRSARRQSTAAKASHSEQKLAPGDGFSMIFRDRYLTWIAVLIVLLNIVNSTGEFLLGDLVSRQAHALHPGDLAAQKQFIGGFYGGFFANVNLLGLLLQLLAVSRIVGALGVRGSLYVLPSISLISYSVFGAAPVLGFVRWGKILENAGDYSIQNTLRQALFLPTSREAKYKAKAAIDTFFMRFGDVLQAGIVRVGAQLHATASAFAWMNVAFTLLWLYAVSRLARQHRRLNY